MLIIFLYEKNCTQHKATAKWFLLSLFSCQTFKHFCNVKKDCICSFVCEIRDSNCPLNINCIMILWVFVLFVFYSSILEWHKYKAIINILPLNKHNFQLYYGQVRCNNGYANTGNVIKYRQPLLAEKQMWNWHTYREN